ncbi:Acetyltransferase (GNAT) family protein [Actinacidiphila yanglinensis]|uniref:Acetyltransferase (GNAT) family protein n=1 Tax=Actinacidiphila yanglinensis TaxID=310779 RepID=A0A1H5Z1C2_9ACTN|nr:GNAT family N-acetyltransferase [Actinacidiphila yanglinensis]SEG29850.1 Acetyltransferase (GNAT) family protein [Actinacidiphila yanglinensis]
MPAPAAALDPLVRWAAQEPGGASRVFIRGDAVAVAAPGLSGRDRLVVAGPAADAVPLVRVVLPRIGPGFRPFGDRALLRAVVAEVPGLAPVADFGWMQTDRPPDGPAEGAAWLTAADADETSALLDEAFPASYAYPGRCGPGERWAGVRTGGRLAAVAALAWCAPDVAFLAGVATAPSARGLGLGRTACAFLLREALADRPLAALVVDDANTPALRLYRALGLAYRPLAAAAQRAEPRSASSAPPETIRETSSTRSSR